MTEGHDTSKEMSPEEFPEDSTPEEQVETSSDELPLLKEKLEEAEREKDQFKRMAQRAQADLVNYRNRVASEQEELKKRTAQRVGLRFVEILDQLERALQPEAASGVDRKWVEGIEAIYQNFLNVFASEGFERFDADGEEFDPRLHDALIATPTSEHRPNTVIAQLSAGYKHRGEVIRPAQVEIAAPEQDADDEEEEGGAS